MRARGCSLQGEMCKWIFERLCSGGDDLFAKAAAFMNIPAFSSMMVGVKESVRHMNGMRSDLHLRAQEFKMLELGHNLF